MTHFGFCRFWWTFCTLHTSLMMWLLGRNGGQSHPYFSSSAPRRLTAGVEAAGKHLVCSPLRSDATPRGRCLRENELRELFITTSGVDFSRARAVVCVVCVSTHSQRRGPCTDTRRGAAASQSCITNNEDALANTWIEMWSEADLHSQVFSFRGLIFPTVTIYAEVGWSVIPHTPERNERISRKLCASANARYLQLADRRDQMIINAQTFAGAKINVTW